MRPMPTLQQPVLERAVTTNVGRALRNDTSPVCDSWSLLLDKLSFLYWKDGFEDKKADAPKSQSLKQVRDCYKNGARYLKTACEAKLRWLDGLARQHGDRFRVLHLVNDSRLLVHLGRASVLENVGLCADRTTGLPCIPGSALKGVLSTWVYWEQLAEGVLPSRSTRTLARKVFGSDDEKDHEAGEIIFIGGFPHQPPGLELDILTPHPEEGRGRIVPNVFLALAKGSIWHFAVVGRPGAETAELLKATSDWLDQCLRQTGLGAKTAAGYGIFRLPTPVDLEQVRRDAEQRLENQRAIEQKAEADRKLAEASPEEQEYQKFLRTKPEWTACAREIASKQEPERVWILRFFRSEEGKAILRSWNNEKGKKRIEALRQAGL
jgi:CRISPR type III-B/RAMP module RAMP protein Cmr6